MQYDILIIGSGPAGYVAAIKAAKLGKRVAVVERAELGGVCLNWGCIPTKALLKSAQAFTYCKNSTHYGVDIEGAITPNMSNIVARSRGVSATMNKGVSFLLSKSGVEVISGEARLSSAHSVMVDGVEYSAESIILATGARPRMVESIPVDGERVITSKEALVLDRVPQSIVVVGSGAIGSEFAYLYAALGSKVTLVEYLPHIMPLEDEEVSKTMERSFRKLKAQVMTSTKVNSVRVNSDGECEVEIEGKKGVQTITAEYVLSAVGIKSNIENIGLEELGIVVERDKVVVDNHYRTSVASIYAVGDIIATPALAHVASAEAMRCVEMICGAESKPIDYETIPSCVFTSPEVASVGLTEAQVVERGLSYSVGRFPFTASGKATAAGERDGFVKIIFGEDKRVLGAHLVGGNVTELIAEPTLAMALGATAEDIASTVHAHPSLNEAIMESAEEALGGAIHL